MINFNRTNNQTGYKAAYERIKKAKKLYNENEGIFTPYERKTIWEGINDDIRLHYSEIFKGMNGELEAGISAFRAAQARTQEARAKEINSWDSAKLQSELSLAQTRIQNALGSKNKTDFVGSTPVSKLARALYQEALQSGDRYKIRAMAEVLQAVDTQGLGRDDTVEMRILGREASERLEAVRDTDEYQAANAAEGECAKALLTLREQIYITAETLGEEARGVFAAGSFSKLTKRIKVNPITGKFEVLEPDDPGVTGIDWNNMNEGPDDFAMRIGGE